LILSDLNLPYYVGKGKGNRAYSLKRYKDTNKVTNYLISNGIKREVRILAKFYTHDAAINYEIERIAYLWYLKEHHILTNVTPGGDGVRGECISGDKNCMKNPAIVAKISGENHWMHGKGYLISGKNNPMFGRKGELAPRYGNKNSNKQKEAARETGLKNKGENNPNYGKVTSPETRAKLSASNVGQKRSEKAKANMRKPKSELGRAAIAASNKRRAELKRLASQNNDGAV
jgi:hypothetical protein